MLYFYYFPHGKSDTSSSCLWQLAILQKSHIIDTTERVILLLLHLMASCSMNKWPEQSRGARRAQYNYSIVEKSNLITPQVSTVRRLSQGVPTLIRLRVTWHFSGSLSPELKHSGETRQTRKPRDFRAWKVTSKTSRSKINTRKKNRERSSSPECKVSGNTHSDQEIATASKGYEMHRGITIKVKEVCPDQRKTVPVPRKITTATDIESLTHLRARKTGSVEGRTPRI